MGTFVLTTMHGMGDCLYLRSIVQELLKQGKKFFLRTSWPQFFNDLPVEGFIKLNSPLRTQKANEEKYHSVYNHSVNWKRLPQEHYRYDGRGNIPFPESLAICAGLEKYPRLVLPVNPSIFEKIAFIRLPTDRREWPAPARNPKQEYMQFAINYLKAKGYKTIGFVNLGEGEYLCEPHLTVDEIDDNISIESLCEYIAGNILISPVGFTLPMSIATGARSLFIFGGMIPPHMLLPFYKTPDIFCVAPDPFCDCYNKDHRDCNKDIEKYRIMESLSCLISERI